MKKILIGAAGAVALGVLIAATPAALGPVLRLANVALASFPAAAAANEGGLLYDSTNNVVKFSDGSSWSTFGAQGADGINPEIYTTGAIPKFFGYCAPTAQAVADWYSGMGNTSCMTCTGCTGSPNAPMTVNGEGLNFAFITATTTTQDLLIGSRLWSWVVEPTVYGRVKLDNTGDIVFRWGFNESAGGTACTSSILPASGDTASFIADPNDVSGAGITTNWMACTGDGGGATACSDTGIALDTAIHHFKIVTSTNTSGVVTQVTFHIDDVVVATRTTTMPTALTNTIRFFSCIDDVDNVGNVDAWVSGIGVEWR